MRRAARAIVSGFTSLGVVALASLTASHVLADVVKVPVLPASSAPHFKIVNASSFPKMLLPPPPPPTPLQAAIEKLRSDNTNIYARLSPWTPAAYSKAVMSYTHPSAVRTDNLFVAWDGSHPAPSEALEVKVETATADQHFEIQCLVTSSKPPKFNIEGPDGTTITWSSPDVKPTLLKFTLDTATPAVYTFHITAAATVDWNLYGCNVKTI